MKRLEFGYICTKVLLFIFEELCYSTNVLAHRVRTRTYVLFERGLDARALASAQSEERNFGRY